MTNTSRLKTVQSNWLKHVNSYDANFVVTGGTGGYQRDNLQCHQLRQVCHHKNSRFQCSVRRGTLQWRNNDRDGLSNQRRLDCLLKRLFRRRSKKTSKLRVTGLCEGNPPVTCGFLSQRASNVENVSIWLRHHHDGFMSSNVWTMFVRVIAALNTI